MKEVNAKNVFIIHDYIGLRMMTKETIFSIEKKLIRIQLQKFIQISYKELSGQFSLEVAFVLN